MQQWAVVGQRTGAKTADCRATLSADHRRKIRSTNPLERFNRDIGRRTDVMGNFPDDNSLIRLASMLAIEWLVGRRYLSAASMGPLLEERPHRANGEEVLELQRA